jgi:hypothetical protein
VLRVTRLTNIIITQGAVSGAQLSFFIPTYPLLSRAVSEIDSLLESTVSVLCWLFLLHVVIQWAPPLVYPGLFYTLIGDGG